MDYTIKYSIECLLGIERVILSSLIYENNLDAIEDSLKIIDSNDFNYEQHGIIYETIIKLYNNGDKIDEYTVFLANPLKINQEYYTSIIATTPISSIIEYLKHLKKDSIKRQIKIYASKIQEGDYNQIQKLQDLHEKFDNLNHVRKLKPFDFKLEKHIRSLDLDVQKIKDLKIEYLYDGFMIKSDIGMIVALPGVGKSLVLFALCNMFLTDGRISRIFYIDGDNSLATIQDRKIHVVKEKFGNLLNYLAESSYSDILKLLSDFRTTDLTDMLIVFDTVTNFLDDRNSHKEVKILMKRFKELRNNGATIIFVHHKNKLKKDFNSDFAGSSSFMEDVSVAYSLEKNMDKQTYILTPLKDRNNRATRIAFKYKQDNTIEKVDLDYALEKKEDIEIRELIINFIKSEKDNPIYSDILKYLEASGYNKDKANKIIQNGKDKYWKAIRLKQNNKLIFKLMDSEDKQDKQDKSFPGDLK